MEFGEGLADALLAHVVECARRFVEHEQLGVAGQGAQALVAVDPGAARELITGAILSGWRLRADPVHKHSHAVLYRKGEALACWQRN